LDTKVVVDGKSVENGNFQFIKDLALWITQEKSVFKLDNPRHHFRNGTTQHGIYRIKDELVIKFSH
jgi:oligosaccharyltransferase complex subunit beta